MSRSAFQDTFQEAYYACFEVYCDLLNIILLNKGT